MNVNSGKYRGFTWYTKVTTSGQLYTTIVRNSDYVQWQSAVFDTSENAVTQAHNFIDRVTHNQGEQKPQ